MIRTSFKKNKRVIIIYLVLLIIGLLTGIFYISKIDSDLYQSLILLVNEKKIVFFNFYHFLFLFMTIFLSFIYIGTIFSFFNMFLEGFSTGIIIYTLCLKKRLKGLIFGIIYALFGKFIYLLLIIVLGIISWKYILNKQKGLLNTYNYLKYSLLVLIISFFNEFILTFFINKLCLYFAFLIK